jgi:hypothetical protein
MRNEPNLSLHAFIKKYLGHTTSNATKNYNSINITTDNIEELIEPIEPVKTKTQLKFDKIKQALSEGRTTYSEMSDIGITAQMYSNYKKAHL